MNRFMSLFFVVVYLLSSCTSSDIAGGTDTGNCAIGGVIHTAGKPATVALYPITFNPYTDSVANTYTASLDSGGRYFFLTPPGAYRVIAFSDDSLLGFQQHFTVAGTDSVTISDSLRPLGKLLVTGEDVEQYDSLYLPGTPLMGNVATGSVLFERVPRGTYAVPIDHKTSMPVSTDSVQILDGESSEIDITTTMMVTPIGRTVSGAARIAVVVDSLHLAVVTESNSIELLTIDPENGLLTTVYTLSSISDSITTMYCPALEIGVIQIGTVNGVYRWDWNTNSISQQFNELSNNDTVVQILSDSENLYILKEKALITVQSDDSTTTLYLPYLKKMVIRENDYFFITGDYDGVFTLNKDDKSVVSYNSSNSNLFNDTIYDVVATPQGVYLASAGGLFVWDDSTSRVIDSKNKIIELVLMDSELYGLHESGSLFKILENATVPITTFESASFIQISEWWDNELLALKSNGVVSKVSW